MILDYLAKNYGKRIEKSDEIELIPFGRWPVASWCARLFGRTTSLRAEFDEQKPVTLRGIVTRFDGIIRMRCFTLM